jgi:hypothetical protein
MSVSDVEKMVKMLKKEKENLLNIFNNKIKKKKSFTNPDSENELLK